MTDPKVCTHPGCARKHYGRGFCRNHWRRSVTGRDMDKPIRTPQKGCLVPACARPHYGNGLCSLHWQRERHDRPLDAPTREPYCMHDTVGISVAHKRVTRLLGRAAEHPCVACGLDAQDWAYDGTDPSQLFDVDGHGSKMFYSRYPEFYMSMCRKCHLGRDRKRAFEQLEEYRTLKFESGLSYKEIRAAVGLS